MKTLPILAACLLIAASPGVNAKTIKYPEKDPSFSITIPDDWTVKPNKDGNLDCETGDGSQFSFSIVPTAEIKKEEELKTYLPALAKTMGEGAEIKELKLGEVKEMKTAKGLKLFGLNAKGQSSGVDMVISLAAFTPKKDTYFVIMAASVADVDKVYDQTMGEIINSIAPIAGQNEK